MKRSISFFLFPLVIVAFYAPTAFGGTFDAETFTLDNGMQVVVIPNHRAPVVSHMVWYKIGAADEPPGKSGVAHFFEHLMFKGTDRIPKGEFSKIIARHGGSDNAFTSQDYTAYYQNVPLENLPMVMEMESDRMRNLNLTEDLIASERDVVLEERSQRIDNNPRSRFSEQLQNALFMNHPYANPVIGWRHEVERLNYKDALEFYKTWYAPNNAILVVSGDITAEKLRPLAEKYYGVIPAVEHPDTTLPEMAPLIAERRLTMTDPRAGTAMMQKMWRAPRGSHATEVLTDILGGTSTSRLYKSIVVEQKLAVSAGSYYSAVSRDDDTFSVYAVPAPGVSVDTLEQAIMAEIGKIVADGVTSEELQSTKDRMQAQAIYARDSLRGPALIFGRALTAGFDIDYVENWPDDIDAVTADDVREAAKAIFAGRDKPVTGVLLTGNEDTQAGG